MRRYAFYTMLVLCITILPFVAISNDNKGPGIKKVKSLIDSVYKKGTGKFHNPVNVSTIKRSLDLCLKAIETNQDEYELLWRGARSAAMYAEAYFANRMDGWEEICREWGNAGERLAIKAQKIRPQRVEAYYWQLVCTGRRASVASTFEIIKENIHGKLTGSLEKAFNNDKSYLDYAPVFSYMQFYSSLPWPFNDYEKAFKYYKQFMTSQKNLKEQNIRCVLCAEFLIALDDDKYSDEAGKLLTYAISDNCLPKYYRDKALGLCKKIDL